MIGPNLASRVRGLDVYRLRSPAPVTWQRFGLVAVLVWSTAWYLVLSAHGGGSWHFFATGAGVLSDLDDGGRSGLHVYAEHPVLQIGPLALAAAWALGQVSDGHGLLGAQLVGAALGIVVVLSARRIARATPALRGRADGVGTELKVLVASACFAPVWLYAAVDSVHLDDIMALSAGVAAVALVMARRPVWAGLAVAVAVSSKPWAFPFAVLLLALPSLRSRAVGVTVAAVGVAASWLPFFIADPQTVRAIHYTIANTPLSGLRLLDVTSARTPPWDRPLQTLVGVAVGGAAIWRGRAGGVLLVVMASRLALDPSTNRYYTAGLAVGALLWDLTGSRRRWPWWSITVLLLLHAARWLPFFDPWHALALVAFAAIATASVLWGGPGRDRDQQAFRSWRPRAALRVRSGVAGQHSPHESITVHLMNLLAHLEGGDPAIGERRPSRGVLLAAAGAASAASAAVIGLIDGVVEHGDLSRYDASVTASVVAARTTPETVLAQVLTFLGSEVSIGILTVALLTWIAVRHRSWRAVLLVGGSMGVAAAVTLGVKHLLARPRPPAVDVLGALDTGNSFPSGHTLFATVFCGLVAGLLLVRTRRVAGQVALVSGWVIVSVGVGLSRLYLGYHWLTDVLAGWSLGVVILALTACAVILTGGFAGSGRRMTPRGLLVDGARAPRPAQR